ncbi:hypothetical protein AB0B27_14060 [Micromonospora rifamycinica]|uniref:hypothetical protein n=1 Tax=Micromonospora rifamycinica TaxID=291594 RepID=UPI0033D08A16
MRRLLTAAATVAALTLLACGSGSDDKAAPPAAEPTPQPSTSTWSTKQRAYLDALAQIDPGLTANEERAIRRAEATCGDITAEGLSGAALTKRVVERLSGGNATIDSGQAEKAITLMRQHIC